MPNPDTLIIKKRLNKNDLQQNTFIVPSDKIEHKLKLQIQNLIKNQKEEYLNTVNILKKRFKNEQQELLTSLQTNTSTPLQNVSIAPTEDEDFVEFKTCLKLLPDNNYSVETNTRKKAATVINAYARGFLVRRLLRTIYVETLIKNIQDTLQIILAFDENCDIIQKSKLFRQLQKDLYRFSGVFFELSIRERMKLIYLDRERRYTEKYENKIP